MPTVVAGASAYDHRPGRRVADNVGVQWPSTPWANTCPSSTRRRSSIPQAVVIGEVEIGAESSVWPGGRTAWDDGPIVVGQRNIQCRT